MNLMPPLIDMQQDDNISKHCRASKASKVTITKEQVDKSSKSHENSVWTTETKKSAILNKSDFGTSSEMVTPKSSLKVKKTKTDKNKPKNLP